MLELLTILTYIFLAAAAAGGGFAAFDVLRKWFRATAFVVNFEGARGRVSAPPASKKLLAICITNRSHRTVTCEGVGLGCPKVMILTGVSIQGGPTARWTEGQGDPAAPGLAFWSATVFGGFYLQHNEQLRLGLEFQIPAAPGKYAFDVLIKPESEPPQVYKLVLTVEAG